VLDDENRVGVSRRVQAGGGSFVGVERAENMDHLVAVDELELSEGQDAAVIERRLEEEVEAGQRLGENTGRRDARK
jgi:hypothetical protein